MPPSQKVNVEEIKRKKKIKKSHKKMFEKPHVVKNDDTLFDKSSVKKKDEDLMAEKSGAKKDDVFQKLRKRQVKKSQRKLSLRPRVVKNDTVAEKSSMEKGGVVTTEEPDPKKDDVDVVYEERRSRRSAKRTYLCLNFSSQSDSEEENEENYDNYLDSCTCMYCEKKFLYKSALNAHLRMHLG